MNDSPESVVVGEEDFTFFAAKSSKAGKQHVPHVFGNDALNVYASLVSAEKTGRKRQWSAQKTSGVEQRAISPPCFCRRPRSLSDLGVGWTSAWSPWSVLSLIPLGYSRTLSDPMTCWFNASSSNTPQVSSFPPSFTAVATVIFMFPLRRDFLKKSQGRFVSSHSF